MRELMSYLPENYPASRETVAFQEALQPELDAIWAARDDLLRQLDPNTATHWGLAYWEDALAIPTVPSMGEELRRRQVVAKLQGMATTTPAVVKTVSETILGVPVRVVEEFGAYRVWVEVQSGGKLPAGIAQLRAQLDPIMPAHLGWGFLIPLHIHAPTTPHLCPRVSVSTLPPPRRGPLSVQLRTGPVLGARISTVTLPMAAAPKGV